MKRVLFVTGVAVFALAPAAYADCSDAHQAAALSAKADQAAPAQNQTATPQASKVAKTETHAPVKQVVKVKAQPQEQQKVASSSTN